MKVCITVLYLLVCFCANAQQDTTNSNNNQPYQRNTITATMALGFVDAYRYYYTLPPAFEKSNTTGFAPFYAKLEYGATPHVSFAATFIYDAFVYNFNQVYQGNNGIVLRYKTNNTRIISGGLGAYYHFLRLFHSPRVDPFIGIGANINNVRYGAYPEGDSTIVKTEHTITPMIKAGARYYLNNTFSLYGDVGFDRQSIFSIGASCRFAHKGKPGGTILKDAPATTPKEK